jgi:hypothetical protein
MSLQSCVRSEVSSVPSAFFGSTRVVKPLAPSFKGALWPPQPASAVTRRTERRPSSLRLICRQNRNSNLGFPTVSPSPFASWRFFTRARRGVQKNAMAGGHGWLMRTSQVSKPPELNSCELQNSKALRAFCCSVGGS